MLGDNEEFVDKLIVAKMHLQKVIKLMDIEITDILIHKEMLNIYHSTSDQADEFFKIVDLDGLSDLEHNLVIDLSELLREFKTKEPKLQTFILN